jgi:hypothetical protein
MRLCSRRVPRNGMRKKGRGSPTTRAAPAESLALAEFVLTCWEQGCGKILPVVQSDGRAKDRVT